MLKLAFSYTLSKLNSWPIILTDNLLDYSQADSYSNKVPYVWFVEKNTKVRDDFNWNYKPTDKERFNVHNFPRCDFSTKRPISWNSVKLVPTFARARENTPALEIRRREIASYSVNHFPCYIYGLNDTSIVKKIQEKKFSFRYNLVKTKNSLTEVYRSINTMISESHVWLIDVDTMLHSDFDSHFEFVPKKSNTIYIFKTKDTSTGISYGSGAVKLVPISYIIAKQGNLKIKELPVEVFNNTEMTNQYSDYSLFPIEVVDTEAGIVNDAYNPMKAWCKAFSRAIEFKWQYSHIDDETKSKILDIAQNSCSLSLREYVADGTRAGLTYYEKNKENDFRLEIVQDYNLLEDRFKRLQDTKSTRKMLDSNSKKEERLEQIYGEDGLKELKDQRNQVKKYRAS